MSYQIYLKHTMQGLSTIVYNVSQNPDEKKCNQIIDSLKGMIRDYNEASGENIDIIDHRK